VSIGEVAGEVLKGLVGDTANWPECGVCRGRFSRLIDMGDGRAMCPGCARSEADAARLTVEVQEMVARFDQRLNRWLRRAGLSDREMDAEVFGIPDTIVEAMPARTVRAMLAGQIPVKGFGLRGTAGIGKTFAIAALVKKMAREKIAGEIQAAGRRAFDPWLTWAAWPAIANRMRVASLRDGGLEDCTRIMDAMATSPVLVIDDLGAERAKAEDWVGSLLDLMVDARYKDRRPTWYTTHLKAEEMAERYGVRMFSRLTGDNPMIEVRGLKDQRKQT